MTTIVYIICMLLFLGPGTYRSDISREGSPVPPPAESGELRQESLTYTQENKDENTIFQPQQSASAEELSQEEAKDSFLTESPPLAGRTICIDPGHQSQILSTKVPIAPGQARLMPNYNIGTVGITTRNFEYAVVLDIAMELEKRLKELGARVVLTRESNDIPVGNLERALLASEAGADITLSLHCDGHEDEKISGLSVLHPGDKYINDQNLLEKSRSLSQFILQHIIKETKARNRGLSPRNDLIIFNYSKNPCALIELGFLTNPEEDRLLNSEDYRNKLIDGIIKGIMEYFKLY